MYHYTGKSGADAKKESYSTFTGLGGLDIKNLQELYLDTSTLTSPSVSPTSTDTPISPLSTAENAEIGCDAFLATEQTQFESQLQQQQQGQQQQQNFNGLARRNVGGNAFLQQYNSQLLLQQQQQQVAAALAAQQQKQQQQNNEISKSLKMFAMLSACRSGHDATQVNAAPVDAVMQDFATNGYISDDHINQQQYSPQMQFNQTQLNSANMNNINLANLNSLLQHSGALHPQAFNSNFTEMRKNFWMLHLPTQSYFPSAAQFSQTPQAAMAAAAATAAATAAAAANIDYNTNFNYIGNINGVGGATVGNTKKLQKRYCGKSDKFSTVKHCVFCENNNEPEPVVKSHAVRDSLGRVLCPKLRTYICPICKASGDQAHTVKYCPQKPIITMEDAIKAESFRVAKSSYYKQQMKA